MSLAEQTSATALRRALVAVREMRARLEASERARTEPIAIVGIGCRFPGGANSPRAFWNLLHDGVDAITQVPADRWDSTALYDRDPAAPGRLSTRWGGFLDQIDRFDAAFFGITPREANQMDPQQRIMMEVAWEALEDAGQVVDRLAGSPTGVFVGVHSHSNDYTWLQFCDPERIDTYTGTGTSHSVVAGRISYLLDLRGPSMAIDTACSSSLVAVHLAGQSLRSGECDLALAGGVNLALTPHFTMATTKMHMMAADGRCKTFDARADGFVRGEGCGMVVLKRLSDAERDGDPVLAVVRGSAVNQDGRTNGLTAPSGLSQQMIIRQALQNAGIEATAVGAVEAHGTGTELGDPIEIEALAEVFGSAPGDGKPIVLSSVKTNIGHLEGAAGVAGLIKVVLSMRHDAIPAHLHFQTLTSNTTVDGDRFVIPTALRPWPRGPEPRCATVSSFGWSGTNGCLVLEEAPPAMASVGTPGGRGELLAISARSGPALRALAESYRALLAGGDEPALHDLCYTASVRRSHHPLRLAVAGRSRAELADRLAAVLADEAPFTVDAVAPDPPAGPVFVFSGQGAQWATMGRDLLDREPVFAETLRRCDEHLRADAGWSLMTELHADSTRSRLDRTEIAQPALVAVQVALAALWRSWGIEPEAVIGHSVGEVAAAHVAGALKLEDAISVALHRGRVMQPAHGHGRMATVALPIGEAENLIAPYGDRLAVAAINSPMSTVIAGDSGALDEAVAAAADRGVFSRLLRVEYAFHSLQMRPLRAPLVQALSGLSPGPAVVPMVSTVTGRPVTGQDLTAEYWGRNVVEPVRFADALAQLGVEAGRRVVIEVGPQPVLARPIVEQLEHMGQTGVVLASMREGADPRVTLLAALGELYRANYPVDWPRLYPAGGRCVALPSYPWQRERYWLAEPPPARSRPVGHRERPAARHPLLGRRARAAMPTFDNELRSTSVPFLGDHRIYGAAVLPMTAYLELALAATAGQVRDLILREPLVLPDDAARSIQLVLGDPDGDRTTFHVYSQPAGAQDDTAWTLHATGAVATGTVQPQPHAPADGDRFDPAALESRLQPADVGPFYQRLRAVGIEYGPAFTGLGQLWRGPGEALGHIVLPGGLAPGSEEYRWHPALLDACLQVALAALPGELSDVYLPVGVDRFQPVSVPGSRVSSHARLRRTGDETAVADLGVYDPDGVLLARIEGLRLKRAERYALLGPVSPAEPNLFYEIAWEPTTLVTRPADGRTGGWLILDDHGGCGAALRDLMRDRGEPAELVGPGPGPGTGPAAYLKQRLAYLKQRPAAGAPCRGVVYLARPDGTGVEPTPDQLMSTLERYVRDALELVHALASDGTPPPRLWLVTRGAQAVAGDTPVAVAQSVLWGLARAVGQEQPALRCTCVDLDPSGNPPVQALSDVLLAAGEESQLAVRSGTVHVARLVPAPMATGNRWPAAGPPVQLRIGEPGLLESLSLQPVTRRSPGPGEVEIRVHAAGLNFRDVLTALGVYPGDAGPLGLECSGEVVAVGTGVAGLDVGDRVLALAPASFATFTTVAAERVARVPDGLNPSQAATIPVAFLTAVYSLHHLARLRPGERVLIHAAAGGVGLAAVQVAQRAGAEVFATASPAKWPLLRQRGVRHVFNSRTADFAGAIRDRTGGAGVDVVLNSLTGEFIPHSFDALRAGGRFIEIGKRGIWPAAKVAQRRPDVGYHPVDLGVVADDDPGLLRTMLHGLMEQFTKDGLTPLPLREFAWPQVVDAFRYMAQARHTGKIVVGPDPPAVRPDATYLITGGLGAVGRTAARWLVGQGARHLVLLSRGAVPEAATAFLADLRAAASVHTRRADVSDQQALSDVLTEISATMPPLRGVVHAAGVLDDGVIEQQTWPRFASVLAPKAVGAWNLHRLTRELPLDFLILCSSAASLLGSAGQSNYVAANAFLDALAHHRRSLGLVATSVNWGPWADAGMAAEMSSAGRQRLRAQGWQPLASEQATRALGRLIEARPVQVGALLVDWPTYLRQVHGEARPLFERLGQAEPPAAPEPTPASGARARIEAAHPGERRQLLREYVHAQAIRIMGLPPAQPVNPQQPLRELGLDSLMAVELRNALGSVAGRSLPSTLAFDHPTVARLADYLFGEMFPSIDAPGEVAGGPADDHDLVARVAALDDADVEALLEARFTALDVRSSHE